MQSPNASMLHYAELEQYIIPRIQKIKANINFWRFSFNASNSIGANSAKVSVINSIIGFPLGLMMYLKDRNKV